jgi:hypothetical protein
MQLLEGERFGFDMGFVGREMRERVEELDV